MKLFKTALIGLCCICGLQVHAQFNFLHADSNIQLWYMQSKHDIGKAMGEAMRTSEFQNVLLQQSVTVNDINKEDFHFIDFDRNGVEDLLFSGKIGSIPYVFIFHNTNNAYQPILYTRGVIYQANAPQAGQMLNIGIWYTACCGYYLCHNTQYVCMSNNNIAWYNTASQTLAFKGTVFPGVLLQREIPFSVNETAMLRTGPYVNNERRIGSNADWRGNGLALYPPHSTGLIYAETMDDKGDYWYFVRMNNDKGLTINSDRFKGEQEMEDTELSYYYGWIHYNDITIME